MGEGLLNELSEEGISLTSFELDTIGEDIQTTDDKIEKIKNIFLKYGRDCSLITKSKDGSLYKFYINLRGKNA